MKKLFMRRHAFFQAREHISVFIFIIVLFLVGVVFGGIIVNSLSLTQKEDLFYYLSQFFGELKQGEVAASTDLFVYSFKENAKFVILIWILGISIIGLPIILLLQFLKGIVVGFTVGFLVNQTGWQGFLLACVSVLPQNIIMVPMTVTLVSCAVIISVKMIKRQFLKSTRERLTPLFKQYMALLGLAVICILAAGLIEAFFSPVLMKMVLNQMGG